MATKKKIKTYGVRGLMEWVCNIPVGKSHMRIEFTGGVLTSYGNTPAKFVTKDLLQQTIIEHSDFYKKKRIVLLSVVETNEDEDRMPKAVKPAAPAPPTPPAEPTSGNDEGEKGATADAGNADTGDDEGDGDNADGDENPEEGDENPEEGDENPEEGDENPKDADETNEGERTPDGKLIVKVTSLDDAKTYLNDKCGIAVRELRSRAKILDAAEANGVSFEGI